MISNNRNGNLTNIEAQVSAEGFREADTGGLRGEICVENTGSFSPENLSIVNAVQVYTGSSVRSFSRTVDVREHPIIDPDGTYCYPYELTVESDAGQVVEFHMTTSITITNHVATLTGSVNCPRSGPCPYGPEIPTDLSLPVP
jgi:hypothetical protein